MRVVSDTTVGGFTFPESVGCDSVQKVLYVSNFGGTELKSGEKDGKGFIMKVALDGKVIEQRAFDVTMNKPKGIWVQGARLWVTDIDSVWIFDTKTKQGRRLPIPGAVFANDPAVAGGVLYVSDNRSDQLFAIEPADFLDAGVRPKVTALWKGKEINPNGLWPARDGSLLMVGLGGGKPRGIYSMEKGADPKALSQPIGNLDGLYELRDGAILATDWVTGSLFRWSAKDGMKTIAKDFKGPADFCVMGESVYVPDLVKSEIRIISSGAGRRLQPALRLGLAPRALAHLARARTKAFVVALIVARDRSPPASAKARSDRGRPAGPVDPGGRPRGQASILLGLELRPQRSPPGLPSRRSGPPATAYVDRISTTSPPRTSFSAGAALHAPGRAASPSRASS
jgi:hypothetical protein